MGKNKGWHDSTWVVKRWDLLQSDVCASSKSWRKHLLCKCWCCHSEVLKYSQHGQEHCAFHKTSMKKGDDMVLLINDLIESCYLCFFLLRVNIQAGRAGRCARATSSTTRVSAVAGCSTSHSCSATESSSRSELSSESETSKSSTGGTMVTRLSAKWTRRFSSTRLWTRERIGRRMKEEERKLLFSWYFQSIKLNRSATQILIHQLFNILKRTMSEFLDGFDGQLFYFPSLIANNIIFCKSFLSWILSYSGNCVENCVKKNLQ